MIFAFIFFSELVLLFFLSKFLSQSLSKIFMRLTKSQNVTIHLLSLFFLPGVIIHELAHLLTASLLFVPVGEMEFSPKIIEDGVKLGGVAIGHTDPFRRAVIGFAPVLFGTALIILIPIYFLSGGFSFDWKSLVIFYLVFEVGNTMFSSRKDVEGTIELMLVLAILFMTFYFIGFRVPLNFISDFLVKNLETLKRMDFILLIPLLIDFTVLGIARFLHLDR